MTDRNKAPPRQSNVPVMDAASYLLSRASGGASMWATPNCDPTMPLADFKRQFPIGSAFNNTPNHLIPRAGSSRQIGSSAQGSSRVSNSRQIVVSAQNNSFQNAQPQINTSKNANGKAEDYVPPHMRGIVEQPKSENMMRNSRPATTLSSTASSTNNPDNDGGVRIDGKPSGNFSTNRRQPASATSRSLSPKAKDFTPKLYLTSSYEEFVNSGDSWAKPPIQISAHPTTFSAQKSNSTYFSPHGKEFVSRQSPPLSPKAKPFLSSAMIKTNSQSMQIEDKEYEKPHDYVPPHVHGLVEQPKSKKTEEYVPPHMRGLDSGVNKQDVNKHEKSRDSVPLHMQGIKSQDSVSSQMRGLNSEVSSKDQEKQQDCVLPHLRDLDTDVKKNGEKHQSCVPLHKHSLDSKPKQKVIEKSHGYVQPYLRGLASEIDSIKENSKPQECAPPHPQGSCSEANRKEDTMTQYIPPHMRGLNSDVNSKYQEEPEEYVPPHLRRLNDAFSPPEGNGTSDLVSPLIRGGYVPPHMRGLNPNSPTHSKITQGPAKNRALRNSDAVKSHPINGKSSFLQQSKSPIHSHFPREFVPKQSLAESNMAQQNNGTGSSSGFMLPSNLKELQQLIYSEMRDVIHKSSATPGPQNSIEKDVSISSHSPGKLSLDDRVSNVGINVEAEMAYDTSRPRENIRSKQGKDPKEDLAEWDGKTWLPPPLDWETERPGFDPSFIPEYCKEWATDNPVFPVFDITAEGFILGIQPVFNHKLSAAIVQPECFPDLLHCEDNDKRLHQTAELESVRMVRKRAKKRKGQKLYEEANEAQTQAVQAMEPEPNPHTPAIDIYLRPATVKDGQGIMVIYNDYINNSIVPEDQEVVTESIICNTLRLFQEEKLPFLVAIEGHLPTPVRQGGKEKVISPQYEKVIGFAFAGSRGYGFSRSWKGRSRFTTNLQLYVHSRYIKKGVGRSLMDRLIQCVTPSYAQRDGYDWINPDNDPTYFNGGGREFHQMLIEYPVQTKNDPNLGWMTNFLKKWFFVEAGRLRAVARSPSIQHGHAATWLDIVFFQLEASHGQAFDPYA